MGGSSTADNGTIGRGPGRGGKAGRTWPSNKRREWPPHLRRPPGQAWAVVTLQTAGRSTEGPGEAARRGGHGRVMSDENGRPIYAGRPDIHER